MLDRDKYSRLFERGKLQLKGLGDDHESWLHRMRYYYGMYSYDNCGIGFGGTYMNGASRRTFLELRNHARGLQNIEKYKDQIDPKDKKDRRKVNISWDTIRILPKFRDIIIDKFDSLILNPGTSAIDHTANRERLIRKNKMKLVRQPETNMFLQDTSYSPDDEYEGIESPDDVEFFFKMGGVRLAAEILMKDGIDLTLYKSNWDVIKKMVIEDIIDVGGFAVDEYMEGGVLKYKYVDPARTIVRPSIYSDFRDSDYRGYIEYCQIAQLRQEAPDVPEAKWDKAAKKYQSYNNNHPVPSDGFTDRGFREDYASAGKYFDDYGVEVLTMYFVDTQIHRFVSGNHARGGRQFEEVGYDFNLSEKARKKGKVIEEYPIQHIYKCRWVVGTDIIFSNGVVDNIVREGQFGSKSIIFPMTVYMSHEPSIIERCISFDDDIQLANYKIRNMIAKLPPPPRIIVNKSKMRDSISIGGEDFTILDMITNYQTDGVMFVESESEFAMPGEEDNRTENMFTIVPDGIVNDMQIMESRIQVAIDRIRNVTGINEVADGTSNNPDMLKSVMSGLQAATNSALSPHLGMLIKGMKIIYKNIGFRYLLLLINGNMRLGALPMAGNTVKMVELTKELLLYEWGFMVEVETPEHRQFLLATLQSRHELLSADNYFMVYNLIEAGDLKMAQLMLAKFSEKAKGLQHEMNKEISQAQAQAQGQAAMEAEKAKASTIQLGGQSKMELAKLQAELDEMKAIKDHDRQKDLNIQQKELEKEKEVAVVRANNQNRLEQ